MDRANKTSVNLNLKDFSDGPQDYIGQRQKYLQINDEEDGVQFVDSHELIAEASVQQDISRSVSRISQIETQLQQVAIEHDLLFSRTMPVSDFIYDSFYDESKMEQLGWVDNPVEVMDDHDWNNNWKFDIQKQIYKQGFARPRKQYYMLELIDRYNLAGVGLDRKCTIDYDATNNCYWMLSCIGENSIGVITKLSPQLRDNKVEVISYWYLPTTGAVGIWWAGICSDGSYLYVARGGLTTNSLVYCFPINSDGTLGVKTPTNYSKRSGENLVLGTPPAGSNSWIHTNAITGYLSDVTVWDSTYIIGIVNNATSGTTLSFIRKSDGGTAPANNITEFARFCGGTESASRAICRRGNYLWLMYNDAADDNRMIYRFDIANDIVNNKVIKASGRFRTAYNIDYVAWSTEGLTIDGDGNIITVSSTTGTVVKLISKFAYTNALWAENQVSLMYPMNAATNPNLPIACAVENERYYWTGDNGVTAGQVDIYRYDSVTGTSKWTRITGLESGSAWTTLHDVVIDFANNKLYLNGFDGTNYKIYHGSLSAFVAYMTDTGGAASSMTLGTTWGAAATGIGSGPGYTTTDRIYGMALNSAGSIIYIVNDTDQKIDTLTLNGSTYTQGVYTLPGRANEAWWGLAYKNGKLYINDKQYTGTGPSYLHVMDVTTYGSSSVWFAVHRHMDPSSKYYASSTFHAMDFDGNDLVMTWIGSGASHFIKMKNLEDPDVLQLHTFLTGSNVLLSSNPIRHTPIVNRTFDPSEYADVRDVPDQYYMGVVYTDEGFSILHLDEFLGDASSTGKARYDPRKIRVWHYKKSTSGGNIVNITTGNAHSIWIEKDIILFNGQISSGTPLVMVDLKSGKAYYSHSGGFGVYAGTLTERNDQKGYTAITNPDLYVSNNDMRMNYGRTFTKEDQSDYSASTPKTFFLVNGAGGSDVIEFDWDENNNRTLKKIWKNIFNLATAMNCGYIFPSGQIVSVREDPAGPIYQPISNTANNEPLKIWDITGQYSYITVVSAGGYGAKVASNARCWKTKNGQWRHILGVSVFESVSNGVDSQMFVDIENKTIERVRYYNADNVNYSFYVFGMDISEDMMFIKRTYYGNPTYYSHLYYPLKKRRFLTGYWSELQNNWDIDAPEGYYLTNSWCNPHFTNLADSSVGSGGTSTNIEYSMMKSVAVTCQYAWGLQLYYYPWIDESKYESKEFDVNNPSEFIYKQSNIIPEV